MTYNIHGTGTVEVEAENGKDATEKFDSLSSEDDEHWINRPVGVHIDVELYENGKISHVITRTPEKEDDAVEKGTLSAKKNK